jgi:hypothetical protein
MMVTRDTILGEDHISLSHIPSEEINKQNPHLNERERDRQTDRFLSNINTEMIFETRAKGSSEKTQLFRGIVVTLICILVTNRK